MKSPIPMPWGKNRESSRWEESEVDIDAVIESLKVSEDGVIEQEGIVYVKGVAIEEDGSVDKIIEDVRKGNIIILDIRKMLASPDATELYHRMDKIKRYCKTNGGDICRISETKFLAVPLGMEIDYSKANQGVEVD